MTHYSLKSKKYVIISIVLMLCIWQIIAIMINNKLLLPSVSDVAKSLVRITSDSNFFYLVIASMLRCLQSFFISIFLASLLAIISYFNKYAFNFMLPVLSIIKTVPTMAFIVLLLIWSSKDLSTIIIGIVIAFPIFYETILNSLINIDPKLIQMCKIYRASNFNKIKNIFIPIIVINIAKILSSTISLIFKVVISAEVYSQPKYGIGAIIQLEKIQLNTDAVIAWILIITLLGYLFDIAINLLTNKIRKEC